MQKLVGLQAKSVAIHLSARSASAQRYFEQALGVARAQQARSITELRAATSLARLWPRSGRAAHGSSRSARSRLRLVHRGLRHARPERGQGDAGGAGLTQLSEGPTALESSGTDYPLRSPLGGFRCCMPSRFLKDRIVPGARPLALIRRRPAPVNAKRPRASSQCIRWAWRAFSRSTIVMGSWT